MDLITKIKDKVRSLKLSLVLPETEDLRVLKAAELIVKEQLVSRLLLLGTADNVTAKAKDNNINLTGCEIIDYLKSSRRKEFAEEYYQLRQAKGLSYEEAEKTLADPLYYAMFLVKTGAVSTAVCGSIATTANVLRSVIHVIGMDSHSRTVSSCFLMLVPDSPFGEQGALLFADAGAVPDPNAEQLADIAINTARTAKIIFDTEPRVALLSFSSKGSAKHRKIEKVVQATAIARQKAPDILIDGELQADSALVPEVAQRKHADSPVAGKANVLIFPDLNSGNICYKLVQRLAKAQALGPLIQGTNKPVSDLSRGCSVEDIVNVSAVTLLRVSACPGAVK